MRAALAARLFAGWFAVWFAVWLAGWSTAAQAQSLEYYTLEMGWLPGQCLAEPDLAACNGLSLRDPAGRNLTLIGLRPEARPGTTRLRDCDPTALAFQAPAMDPGDIAGACSLPRLRLDDGLAAALAGIMPGAGAACAERIYWSSFGSCSMLSQQRYFERAVARAEDLQRSLINLAIAAEMGGLVSRDTLAEAFRQQFGAESDSSLQLVCARSEGEKQSVLTGIRVMLNQLGTMRALAPSGLWRPAGSSTRLAHRCPERFLVAEPGGEEPPLAEKPPEPGKIAVPPVVVPPVVVPPVVVPPVTVPAIPQPAPFPPTP